MLYKKNKERTLSYETFKNPTEEYRGTPFWAWNCKMTKQILERQIEYLGEMGFGGFHMHSRSGIPGKSGKQPWALAPEVPEHTSTIRFTFNSETTVSGASFACEDMDAAEIFFDGKEMEKRWKRT